MFAGFTLDFLERKPKSDPEPQENLITGREGFSSLPCPDPDEFASCKCPDIRGWAAQEAGASPGSLQIVTYWKPGGQRNLHAGLEMSYSPPA